MRCVPRAQVQIASADRAELGAISRQRTIEQYRRVPLSRYRHPAARNVRHVSTWKSI